MVSLSFSSFSLRFYLSLASLSLPLFFLYLTFYTFSLYLFYFLFLSFTLSVLLSPFSLVFLSFNPSHLFHGLIQPLFLHLFSLICSFSLFLCLSLFLSLWFFFSLSHTFSHLLGPLLFYHNWHEIILFVDFPLSQHKHTLEHPDTNAFVFIFPKLTSAFSHFSHSLSLSLSCSRFHTHTHRQTDRHTHTLTH